ncbi:MAG TPA: hypothetical protein VJP76_01780 [Candidatus Tumulicola sp.]|nr:hypothetical protein [Candidatus Tumulicola sp.]
MTVVSIVARILLGIVFAAVGALTFFMPPPPMPGMVGQFNAVFAQSHWNLFIAAAQFVLGVLLLINRYVPVALIMLAAFLYNSFAFHITIMPAFVIAPIIVLILWFLVAWPHRAVFAPLFQAKA